MMPHAVLSGSGFSVPISRGSRQDIQEAFTKKRTLCARRSHGHDVIAKRSTTVMHSRFHFEESHRPLISLGSC
jgi:hypothetical protein